MDSEKWIKRWEQESIFQADPKDQNKFFLTFPYPYINLFPHIGHFYSLMRVEAFARYKRMNGYNVLFPQAWHATGSPMVNAAKRVENGEKKQIDILLDMGFSKQEIPKFNDPKYWIKVFSKGWQEDLTKAGISIDWRRNFYTTSMNPHYDKFIRWQFRRLKQKGHVVKGKKPVVWCPTCEQAIGDHARVKGEGETPQEYTILKLALNNSYVCCASLRPETVFGQTNVWIDPETEYVKADINGEEWIVSRPCAEKLASQDKKVTIKENVKGSELIGQYVNPPGVDREIPILPSTFCDPNVGTGIVTSVPSDAPDDFIGLRDLWEDKELCEKYGLDWEEVKRIEIIPIIKTEEWGNTAGKNIVEKWEIKNQKQRSKLEKARKIVYKEGFHKGVMNENCGKYAGMPVIKAKEDVKNELIESGQADKMYELTGDVVCRCLTPAIIKIVSNQWFLEYSDPGWKKLAHECLDDMELYPEKIRTQFDYVIDWLNDWACTHKSETELGTELPWDEKWVIESLSDSTIYMAYYTISHIIKEIDPEKINDAFFDYVFYGKKADTKVAPETLEKCRKEFTYWYPMDLRSSGKDLIQNHLTFSIFIHTAMFPEEHWPKAFSTNGWVTVDGTKMSKSLGNVIPVRKMIAKYGADASRFTVLNGGEGADDANWDSDLAESMKPKLESWLEFCEKYGKGREEHKLIDEWMESKLNTIIKNTTRAMDEMLFRSALQCGYFDLQRALKWYLRRSVTPNKEIMKKIIEAQTLLLAPFTPFVCEEIWERIGKDNLISVSGWPEVEEDKIKKQVEYAEETIKNTISDIQSVIELSGIEPEKIILYIAPEWKFELFNILKDKLDETREFKELMSAVMKDPELRKHGQEISGIIRKALKNGIDRKHIYEAEKKSLQESTDFFSGEFNSKVVVEESTGKGKSKQAVPGRPAILVK